VLIGCDEVQHDDTFEGWFKNIIALSRCKQGDRAKTIQCEALEKYPTGILDDSRDKKEQKN
jgi:hypothetical protein